jgi:hypothetical protein
MRRGVCFECLNTRTHLDSRSSICFASEVRNVNAFKLVHPQAQCSFAGGLAKIAVPSESSFAPTNYSYVLVACVLDNESDVLGLCEPHTSSYISRVMHLDCVLDIVAGVCGLQLPFCW